MNQNQVQFFSCHPAKPWLKIPLQEKIAPNTFDVCAGWLFDEIQQEITGIINHCAIDFAEQYGAPVYAAARGLAVCTYHLKYGQHPYIGKKVGLGLGHLVQIYHPEQDLCTAYANLSAVSRHIPYLEPTPTTPGPAEFTEYDPQLLYVDPATIVLAKPVEAGELIGLVGTSGMEWGMPGTPQLQSSLACDSSWGPPVLHFELYQRAVNGSKVVRLDPFGKYSDGPAYRNDQLSVVGHHPPLWLTDDHGHFIYASPYPKLP